MGVGMTFSLEKVQKAIQTEGLDGWLFYDFQGLDPVSKRILDIPIGHLTRRWYYFVPKEGSPRKLMHKIEPSSLAHLPGEERFFAAWKARGCCAVPTKSVCRKKEPPGF